MKNEDKPAFAHQETYYEGFIGNGLTKREYFVAQALAGYGIYSAYQDGASRTDIVADIIDIADTLLARMEETENTES